MSWGYAKQNGPATWHKEFPLAGGVRQSPIDIKVERCQCDNNLGKVNATYDNISVRQLTNSGKSWKAQAGEGKTSLRGGPLNSEFVLEELHCHWGKANDKGSEHTIDGQQYPAELHMVHWNKDKCKSFGEAASSPNGLAVLGVFLKVGSEHRELKKITKLLPFVQFKSQSISMVETIQPGNCLPSDGTYWTYPGSLTTPPCYESVNWIVFENPIEISQEQLNQMRNLKSFHPCEKCPEDELSGCMVENYRPACPINERVVRVFKDYRSEE